MLKVEDRVLTNAIDVMDKYHDKFVVFERADDDDFMEPGYVLFICDSYSEAGDVRFDTQKLHPNLRISVVPGEDWWTVL